MGLTFRLVQPVDITDYIKIAGQILLNSCQIGGKARKIWPTLDDAISHIQPNLNLKNEFIIVINNARRIDDWYV